MRGSRRPAGFTLIELMIAMTILASISLGIYDITTGTFDKREKIEAQGDFYNSLRVGLEVLNRDVTQMYSPQGAALPGDLSKGLLPAQPQQNLTGAGGLPGGQLPYNSEQANPGTPLEYWTDFVNQQGVRRARFQGDESKMSFVTSSHVRIYRDVPESEFAKVRFAIEDQKSPDPNLVKGSKLLVKHENVDVFSDDDTRAGESDVRQTLVENVKSVSFEYYDTDKDTWEKRWDTTGVEHKDIFPAIVRLTIEVYVPNSENTLTVMRQFRPELNL